MNRGLLATSCVLALILAISGCLHGPANNGGSGEPALYQTNTNDLYQRFRAWKRHTDGRVGQDVHPTTLAERAGIVFSSNRHSRHYKLYMRHPDGYLVRQLSYGPGDDLFAAAAPTGDRVVFSSDRSGTWQLYLLEHLEDRDPKRLGEGDAASIHPAWAPDGQSLAYSRLSPVSGDWEIWIYDLRTATTQRLVSGLFADYHPDGKRVVFQRPRQRDGQWYSIWTVQLDGTRETEIIAGRDYGAVNPTWSPDGEWIAYNTVSPQLEGSPVTRSGDDIYMVRYDGRQETRLTQETAPVWNPHWSADGAIYFCSAQGDQTAIWSLSPET
ncbi:MAG: hypothetical protein AAF581_05690 [Planctomycetota bacterium]